ncbi:unnamed protein product [Darwinula stevensoni]|uniref:Uncharacterized protein n=1 Tax=Darwinula stevensoni TaxID=69355 RepID=A0A7R9ADI4_9CRUS|nr:unnamed protein product [Darwinula stevensoni]CAG0901364.1 unnamed protein product [Darwinula stevensoni]
MVQQHVQQERKGPSLFPLPTQKQNLPNHTAKVFVALYDYKAQIDEDLSFKKGEHLEVIIDTQGDWWYARSKATKEEGFLPSNYVAKLKPNEADPWYFGNTKRTEAEKKLLLPENDHGAFLIRDSESRPNDYSLSVKYDDTVKHYRIKQREEVGFFIGKKNAFGTLQELVDHYSNDADGLGSEVPELHGHRHSRCMAYPHPYIHTYIHTYIPCFDVGPGERSQV